MCPQGLVATGRRNRTETTGPASSPGDSALVAALQEPTNKRFMAMSLRSGAGNPSRSAAGPSVTPDRLTRGTGTTSSAA